MDQRPTKPEGASFRAYLRRINDTWQASYMICIPTDDGGFRTPTGTSETHIFSTDKAGTRWLSAEAQALGFLKEEIVWK